MRWGSTYSMVSRIVEQQQAICAVLVEDRMDWHRMPSENEFSTLESLVEVLKPLSVFTDAFSGETMLYVDPHLVATSPISLCTSSPSCTCFSLRSLVFFQLRLNNSTRGQHFLTALWTRSKSSALFMARSRLWPKQLTRIQSKELKAATKFDPLSVVVAKSFEISRSQYPSTSTKLMIQQYYDHYDLQTLELSRE